MEQRLRSNYAKLRGAQIKPSKEEYVLGMGQRGNDAATRDAQTKL